MDRIPWATYLWPGVPQLSKYGTWSFLAVAVLFGLLLNTAVLSTWVWSELLSSNVRNLAWLVVAVSWVGFALFSHRWNQRQQAPVETPSTDDQFCKAQDQYLQGNWFEAQQMLTGLVRRNPRDVDSRLMLATLLRHTGRIHEAAQHLRYLERLEGAGKWELEICREWELLTEACSSGDEGSTPSPEPSGDDAAGTIKDAA